VVGGGGGLTAAVESELLGGQPVRGANMIRVRTPVQLVAVVEQEPNALGTAQLTLAKQKNLPEIVTERPLEQILSLITLGEPTAAMKAVIDASKQVAARTM
jgi:ABC-type phosphate transport system substrate-binding protein